MPAGARATHSVAHARLSGAPIANWLAFKGQLGLDSAPMNRGTALFVNSREGCESYVDALSDCGVTVIHTIRPEDALTSLSTDRPDVVVTDLAFADARITGAEFIREVRSIVDDATSIIVLSQYVRVTDRTNAREAGADVFLMKPALASAVAFEVQRALILRRGGRRLAWNWPGRLASVVPFPLAERRRRSSHS